MLDKQQLVNKKERMRLIDVTQSFNILDSIMFKEAKFIQEQLEANRNYNLLSDSIPKPIKKQEELAEEVIEWDNQKKLN